MRTASLLFTTTDNRSSAANILKRGSCSTSLRYHEKSRIHLYIAYRTRDTFFISGVLVAIIHQPPGASIAASHGLWDGTEESFRAHRGNTASARFSQPPIKQLNNAAIPTRNKHHLLCMIITKPEGAPKCETGLIPMINTDYNIVIVCLFCFVFYYVPSISWIFSARLGWMPQIQTHRLPHLPPNPLNVSQYTY